MLAITCRSILPLVILLLVPASEAHTQGSRPALLPFCQPALPCPLGPLVIPALLFLGPLPAACPAGPDFCTAREGGRGGAESGEGRGAICDSGAGPGPPVLALQMLLGTFCVLAC